MRKGRTAASRCGPTPVLIIGTECRRHREVFLRFPSAFTQERRSSVAIPAFCACFRWYTHCCVSPSIRKGIRLRDWRPVA